MIKEWKFPSTRYQGSKRKLIPWIYENVKNIQFESVVDLFGGSGIVCYLFKKMEKRVTYNDYLKFNSLIGKAIIENSSVRLSDEDIGFILGNGEAGHGRFIYNTFKGIYFTDDENSWLDLVNHNIVNLCKKYSGQILEYKRAIAYYALFQSCMVKRPFNLFHRNNLSIRTADVERRFGNKTTWDKPFEIFFRKFANEANSLVFSNGKRNRAKNEDAFQINEVDYDLVYIDPPYFSKDRSPVECDYSRMYHFLEGIANYDTWNDLIDYKSLNLHFKENGYRWPEKNKVLDKFEQLFSMLSKSIIILSYKSPGIPKEEELTSIMRKYKQNVQVYRLPYRYALRKAEEELSQNFELLIIGR
jgi:adenine-specific DNA methylase